MLTKQSILFADGDTSDGDQPSQLEQYGAILNVEGYFPGTQSKVDLRDDNLEPDEWPELLARAMEWAATTPICLRLAPARTVNPPPR